MLLTFPSLVYFAVFWEPLQFAGIILRIRFWSVQLSHSWDQALNIWEHPTLWIINPWSPLCTLFPSLITKKWKSFLAGNWWTKDAAFTCKFCDNSFAKQLSQLLCDYISLIWITWVSFDIASIHISNYKNKMEDVMADVLAIFLQRVPTRFFHWIIFPLQATLHFHWVRPFDGHETI